MKRIKTDELGLHPLTLQDVEYLQSSYFDGFKQTIVALVGNSPCILWGMQKSLSTSFGNTLATISEGVYWDGTEILRHSQTVLTYPSSTFNPQVYLIPIIDNAVLPPVVYKNGQAKNVYTEKYIESTNIVSSTINLDAQLRLDNILKGRMGIPAILTNISTLQSTLTIINSGPANGNINQWVRDIEQSLATLVQDFNDHVSIGGHPYQAITNKPFIHGSAFFGDIGVTSPAFPHTMGSNCRRVAGTATDSLYEITLPNGTNIPGAYHVYGSIVGVKQGSSGGNYSGYLWDNDNDVSFVIVKKDPTKFHVAVREYAGNAQELWFEFMVVDTSKV